MCIVVALEIKASWGIVSNLSRHAKNIMLQEFETSVSKLDKVILIIQAITGAYEQLATNLLERIAKDELVSREKNKQF